MAAPHDGGVRLPENGAALTEGEGVDVSKVGFEDVEHLRQHLTAARLIRRPGRAGGDGGGHCAVDQRGIGSGALGERLPRDRIVASNVLPVVTSSPLTRWARPVLTVSKSSATFVPEVMATDATLPR